MNSQDLCRAIFDINIISTKSRQKVKAALCCLEYNFSSNSVFGDVLRAGLEPPVYDNGIPSKFDNISTMNENGLDNLVYFSQKACFVV